MKYFAFAMTLLLGTAAHANDPAAAAALFDAGRALFAQGKYVEACAKFEASDRADPAIGTELNLAACDEKLGKTASAWALYTQVASSPNAGARAAFARAHADALAPSLARVNLRLGRVPPGLRVTLDGVVVAINVSIPVDPGTHAIVATAPGVARYSTTTVAAPSTLNVVTLY